MTLVKHPAHAFNSFFDELFAQFPANVNREFYAGAHVPVNIHETKDAYHLELSAPGRNKEDFQVSMENGMLTVSFEKKESQEVKEYKTIRKEFSFQSFKRSFSLDDKVNIAGIQAKYENGVLKVLLPKKAEVVAEPKQIAVN
ncbi:MAG TPA: Hsp20/alpha crystallin family protein [Sediminibacterium sp.]|nr:Hsp20/alpha crystallin family protein [Sediminibacterium sp.]